MLTRTIIENALVIAGEGFWVISSSSQLKHLVKTRNTHGLSAVSTTLNSAGNMAWVTYFATQKLVVPFAMNIVNFMIGVTTLGYILGNKRQFKQGLTAIIILGPLTSYLLIAYPSIAGWIGVVYNAIAGTPWVVRVVRTKRVTGISAHSMYFALAAMLFTTAYALLIHSTPLIVGCAQALVYELIVLRYYYRHRHRA